MEAAKQGDLARISVYNAEDRVIQALEGVARAKKERDRAECKISRARVNLDEEHTGRDKEDASLEKKNGRTESKREATERRHLPRGSSRRKTQEPPHTVRYWYPATVTTDIVTPDRWPKELNTNKPTETYDEAGASLEQSQAHGYPTHSPQVPRQNHRPHSPSLRNTADQTQFDQAPLSPHIVEERRPPHAYQSTSYHKAQDEPHYRGPTKGGTSRGIASTEDLPSHHQRETSRGRHPTQKPWTTASFEPNTSYAQNGSRPPVSSQQARPTTVASSSQRRSEVLVSELPRSQSKSQAGSVGTQQATRKTYNRTRRGSINLEVEALQSFKQNATSAVESSHARDALHHSPMVSRSSNIPVKAPLILSSPDTKRSTGASTPHATKQKLQGPRRKKDTLGMPFGSGLGGGW